MELCTLRKSAIDPEFFEILVNGIVIQEVKISFKLYRIPKTFPSVSGVLSWIEETGLKLAKASAYRMLARRNYSKAILQQKLMQKGFSETICEKVIETLERLGFLSDETFAEKAIEQKIAQGYGPFYIEQYMKQQGLRPSLISNLMDEKTQKKSLEKWRTKLKGKEKNKQIAFLLRKGFSFNICRDFIEEL